jgi:hypothetical protein
MAITAGPCKTILGRKIAGGLGFQLRAIAQSLFLKCAARHMTDEISEKALGGRMV